MQRSSRRAIRSIARLALPLSFVAGFIGIPAPSQAVASFTAFTLDSQPGDWVGLGQSFTFTPSNATVTAGGFATFIHMEASDGTHSFVVQLEPPTGGSFTAGTTYDTAQTADASHARFTVSGDGRGCSTTSGSITVKEVSYDVDDLLASLAVTYEQHCDGATPALYGELRYRSPNGYKADTVQPPTVDFGDQPFVASGPVSVTIANTGSSALVLGTAAITGSESSDYAITSDTCSGTSPASGSTCAFTVVFTPGGEGTRSALLAMSANTARGAVEIPLTGKGVFLKTTVTLKTSASKVNLNGSVTVTAHLEPFQDTQSTDLEIFATPYGGTKRLIKSGAVDGSGNLSVKVSLTKRTVFVARFEGDALYRSDSSPSKTVWVYPVVKETMIHSYGRSGKYHLYRYSLKCVRSHRRCPTVAISVKPNHHGKPVRVTLQVYARGAWRTAFQGSYRLNAKSKAGVFFFYRNNSVINLKARVSALFRGDADHLSRTSSWAYFRVTK